MSKKSNTEQRRSEIVNALLTVIAEHGYAKATIQLIAQKAGLTPGLIHYHFKTKAEILLELVRMLADLPCQRYLQFSASADTPDEKLLAYISARLAKGDGANPTAVAAWVVIGAEAVRQPEVREIYQQAIGTEFALIKTLLTDCLAAKQKNEAEIANIAAGLLALMEGAFQLACAAPHTLPSGYAASMAVQYIRQHGIG